MLTTQSTLLAASVGGELADWLKQTDVYLLMFNTAIGNWPSFSSNAFTGHFKAKHKYKCQKLKEATYLKHQHQQ